MKRLPSQTRFHGLLFAALFLVALGPLSANGGAPLLLVSNGMAFLYGGVLIVGVEAILYARLGNLDTYGALIHAFAVNAQSTILVGLGLPIALGIASLLAAWALPDNADATAMALGTWVYGSLQHPRLTFGATCLWLLVTFVLTVYLEAWSLRRRLAAADETMAIQPLTMSWLGNSLTYTGIAVFLAVYWGPSVLP